MPGKTPPVRKAPKATPTPKPAEKLQGAGVKGTALFPKKSTPFGPYRKA